MSAVDAGDDLRNRNRFARSACRARSSSRCAASTATAIGSSSTSAGARRGGRRRRTQPVAACNAATQRSCSSPIRERALSPLAAAFYGDPSRSARRDRRDRHQREDDDHAHDRGNPQRRRHPVRRHRHGRRASSATRHWELAQHDAAAAGTARAARRDARRGAQAVAMEVSSHALALDRVDDVRFPSRVLNERHARPSRLPRLARGVSPRRSGGSSTVADAACSTSTTAAARVGRANCGAAGRDAITYGMRGGADRRSRAA